MKVAIGFEGLFSYNAGYVRRGVLDKLPATILKYSRPWTANYDVSITTSDRVCIIGHSFGVREAIKAAAELKARGMNVVLVLCDPRMPPFGTGATAPEGVDTYNFYRTTWIPFALNGRRIEGAFNVKLSSRVGHTSVPFQSEVLAKVKEILEIE